MGYEPQAASRGSDLTQIERDWTMAQARIDALAEAGTQAIQQLLQDSLEHAGSAGATPNQRTDVQAMPDPASYDIDQMAEAV
jgi:hypothetical protein